MKDKKGSITVEAVFLIPFLMMVLLFFLWLSFYLHDRVIIRGTMQRVIESGGDYLVYGTIPESGYLLKSDTTDRGLFYAVSSSEAQEEGRMEAYFERLLSGKLFLCRMKDVQFQKRGGRLILKAEFDCPGFAPLASFMKIDGFTDVYEESCFWTVREEITRIGSVVLEMFNKIKK